MPTYKTSQEWLDQSALLLQARPTTTRVTTKYSIKPAKLRGGSTQPDGADTSMADAPAAKPPRGALELKTFDPISGVALKYRTAKAAEVSRLIHCLGKLGREMAALPPQTEDEETAGGVPEESEGNKGAAAAAAAAASGGQQQQQQQGQAQGGGGGGKKKRKGKK